MESCGTREWVFQYLPCPGHSTKGKVCGHHVIPLLSPNRDMVDHAVRQGHSRLREMPMPGRYWGKYFNSIQERVNIVWMKRRKRQMTLLELYLPLWRGDNQLLAFGNQRNYTFQAQRTSPPQKANMHHPSARATSHKRDLYWMDQEQGASAKDPSPRSSWPYLYCLQIPLGQARLPVKRGEYSAIPCWALEAGPTRV